MDNSKKTNFDDRLSAAANAKKAQLEKFRARSGATDPAFAERQAARRAVSVARDTRTAERNASRLAGVAREAADKAARTQLQALRSQIEMYKVQHGGALPDLLTSWNPLINATVYNGKTVGPYIPRAPKNGLNNLGNVVDGDGTASVGGQAGFVYDYAGGGGTGKLMATNADGTSIFPQ